MIQLLTATQIEVFLALNVAVCVATIAVNSIGRGRRMARIGGG